MTKKPTDFEKLQTEWYDRLKNSGFEDAEDNQGRLKHWSSRFAHSRYQELMEDWAPYYDLATQLLNDHKFSSVRDKVIWTYHANGMSVRDIVETLEKVGIHTNRDSVHKTVQRLFQIMKKKYIK